MKIQLNIYKIHHITRELSDFSEKHWRNQRGLGGLAPGVYFTFVQD